MKYILLFFLSSMLFVSCSNMDPEHYDTPKTQADYVLISNDDTVYRVPVTPLKLKAEDYPLNKWRWEHETDVTNYFTNPDGSQTVVQECDVHRYTGSESLNGVELYVWAIIHHDGKRKAKTDTLNVVCNEYGVEALKDVELYSFWK